MLHFLTFFSLCLWFHTKLGFMSRNPEGKISHLKCLFKVLHVKNYVMWNWNLNNTFERLEELELPAR